MQNGIMIEELQKRMRPGAWSQQGFLGENESLLSVIAEDRRVLEQVGIPSTQIALQIEQTLQEAKKQRLSSQLALLNQRKVSSRQIDGKEQQSSDRLRVRQSGHLYPDLYPRKALPQFSFGNLPNPNFGVLVDKFQVFITRWRGTQACPWGCKCDAAWASFDFLILNRNNGEFFTGPALIVHLIQQHEFFEGKESPYRVDPLKVLRVFEYI